MRLGLFSSLLCSLRLAPFFFFFYYSVMISYLPERFCNVHVMCIWHKELFWFTLFFAISKLI